VFAQPVTVRRLGIGLAAFVALLTSACAAGQHASTSEQRPSLDGTNGSVGSINLRGIVIEAPSGTTAYYPVGSDAAVKIVLVNNGTQQDRLISITSPAVTDWGSFATTSDADAVIEAHSSPSAAETKSGKAKPSGTPSATTLPLPTPSQSIAISAGSRRSWGTPESKGTLLLIHTTKALYPGTTIPLTFQFANAGSVTLAVPIALSRSPQTSVIPEPSSSIEG
jgi:copper(I)-binding protein